MKGNYVINWSNYVAEQSSVNIVNISKAKEAMESPIRSHTRKAILHLR